jgi:hypothetical protein
LASRSDVVLMDLRGFQARNEGCRHELASLASGERIARVVLLVDAATDRGSATAAVSDAPAGRFDWIDVGASGRLQSDRLLAALFADPPTAAS